MKYVKLVLILSILSLTACVPFLPASAAGGTNGNLESTVSSVIDGTPFSIKAKNLDVSSDYALVVNGVVLFNLTTSSTQTSFIYPLIADEYGSTGTMLILLTDSNVTTIDTVELLVTEVGDYINEDQTIDIIVPLLIMGIFASVAAAIIYKKRT